MEILKTYRLADFGGGLIGETAELKLVAEKSNLLLPEKATQSEVNSGTNNEKFLTPETFTNAQQLKAIVVSSNITATLNRIHNVTANATLTDATPVEGMGYMVNVINGVATVGGVTYPVGSQLFRSYHSGSWKTFEYLPNRTQRIKLTSDFALTDTTSRQSLFGQSLNVEVGTYSIEILAINTNLSSSSKTHRIYFGGTSIYSNFIITQSNKADINAAGTGNGGVFIETPNNYINFPSGTNTDRSFMMSGEITFTTAGTFIPEFFITVSQAGMLTLSRSYCKLIKM